MQAHGNASTSIARVGTPGTRWRLRRLNRLERRLAIQIALVLLVVCAALAAPLLSSQDPKRQQIIARMKPPGATLNDGRVARLGTDQLGRDMYSRILYGARISLLISITGTALAALIGVPLGLIAGYGRRGLDVVIMRLVDIQLGFPGLLLAITLAAVLGRGLGNVILALGVANWTTFARVMRASVLTLRDEEFVHAAQAAGASNTRILARHILPNASSALIVIAALQLGQMILAESGLSFIGLGVDPTTPSWGSMISDGRQYVTSAWWLITFPGLAITFTALIAGLLGDTVRDLLDPHSRARVD